MNNNLMTDEAAEAFVSSLIEPRSVFERSHWEGNSLSKDAINNLELAMRYRKNLKKWCTPKFINQIQENKISFLGLDGQGKNKRF
jgi:hypothetical protein